MIKLSILLISIVLLSFTACADSYYYEYDKKVQLTKLPQNDLHNHITYYQTPSGERVGVPQEIIVQCNPHIDCKERLSHYPIKKIEKLSDNLLLLKVANSIDILKLSQKLYHDRDIKFAHPNFIKSRKKR
jgi:hypothetical protein